MNCSGDATDRDSKRARFTSRMRLHHLDLSAEEATKGFDGARFVCIGGTEGRMRRFARVLAGNEGDIKDLAGPKARFCLLRVGDCVIGNHGMGAPSTSILINELVLALRMAEVEERKVVFFRMGTSGGIGVEPGTVVVTEQALNEKLEPFHEVVILGKQEKYSTGFFDPEVANYFRKTFPDEVIVGKTMSANCFFSNQGRLDSPFTNFTKTDVEAFLQTLVNAGVKNIEMEGVVLAGLLGKTEFRACVICMPLVNRLNVEHPNPSANPERVLEMVAQYIHSHS